MGGREYLGCLLGLAALCVLAGAPILVVAGVVLWKLLGGVIILGGAVLLLATVAVVVGGLASVARRISDASRR